MKKNELILCSVILFVSLVGCIVFMILEKNTSFVSIAIDGVYHSRYSLYHDKEVMIEDDNGGWNLLVIENGTAYIDTANCPSLDCVKQGAISRNNQSIICLPHRVTVTISNLKEDKIDEETR